MDRADTALIGNIQKFSTQDGPGIRSTVFLKGCPLKCVWCHNPEMINPAQQMILSPSRCIGCRECIEACPENGITVGEAGPLIDFSACRACGECVKVCFAKAITPVAEEMTVADIMEQVLQDKEFYDNTNGGVTLSGGEVLMHHDFASEIIDACGRKGINVCLDTCGFGDPDELIDLSTRKNVQYILYDIKHMDGVEHKKLTGVDNKLILSNLKMLAARPDTHDKLWIRMPLISRLNDGEDAISQAAEMFRNLSLKKVSLLGYHEMGVSKAKHTGVASKSFEAPSDERMNEIKALFEGIGMEAEISGKSEKIMK